MFNVVLLVRMRDHEVLRLVMCSTTIILSHVAIAIATTVSIRRRKRGLTSRRRDLLSRATRFHLVHIMFVTCIRLTIVVSSFVGRLRRDNNTYVEMFRFVPRYLVPHTWTCALSVIVTFVAAIGLGVAKNAFSGKGCTLEG